MSDEQALITATVRRILSQTNVRSEGQIVVEWPSRSWRELEGAGLTGVGVEEARGGSGGSFTDVATALFEVGRHATLVPLAETMLAGWLGGRSTWDWSGGPETVSVGDAMNLVVRRNGTELQLDGIIPAVPWARVATRILIVVDSEIGPLLARLEPEDFTIEPGINLAGEYRDAVVLTSARLISDRWQPSSATTQEVRLRGALMRAVSAAGCMSSILELTTAYAHDREQFGRPIEKFQAIQQLLARLAAEVFASSICIRNAVTFVDAEDGALASMSAVVRVSQAATNVARIAHQIHGAIGITEEHSLHYFTSRLWCWRNEFGGETEWSREISKYVRIHGGVNHLWSLMTEINEEIS
jgi:acyl-CoA dehydrogenase